MSNDYQFKGYDFYELVNCFIDNLSQDGLENKPTSEQERIMVERLKEYLIINCNFSYKDDEVIKKVREFINALCNMGEQYNFSGRYVWEGLRKTEDDVIMMRYLTDCIYNLWN